MAQPFTTRPEIRGTFGAVASTHWLGSAVGMAVLERGGNAFDAAVAAGFVLQIVEPHLNGPGGEVPIILKRTDRDEPQVICGQGVLPAAATMERFTDLGLAMVPGTGLLPSVVPGAFDAWMLLLRDHGTLPLDDVLGYAIGYAESGFPLVPRAVASILPAVDWFKKEWPTSAAVWLPGGEAPAPGRLFRSPGIAACYRRILAEARKAGGDRVAQIQAARRAFYRGFVAEAIDRFYASSELRDSSGRRHRGLLTGEDLARWEARTEPTVWYDYAGVRVHKTGPWGQGPVLLQQLALLSGFDLGALDPVGAEFVHTVIECAKLAFADREVFYGDPDFSEVPLATLLSRDYNDARRRLVASDASLELRPGNLPDAQDRLALILARAGSEQPVGPGGGEPTYAELPEVYGDTVHLDVVDRFGNLVSATPSGGWLQSSPVVPGLGFSISTRAQIAWLQPGLPSSLRPGMRPRTTLTPTLVTRDGEGWLAIGTPGGDQQDQWTLITFLRHLHHGQNLQMAIDAPNFHSRHFPSSFYPRGYEPGRLVLEDRFCEAVRDELAGRGHRLKVEGPWALGRVCAAARSNGILRAAATPRHMQGYAAGR